MYFSSENILKWRTETIFHLDQHEQSERVDSVNTDWVLTSLSLYFPEMEKKNFLSS